MLSQAEYEEEQAKLAAEATKKAEANIGIFPELTEEQKREIAIIKDAAYHTGYEQRKKEDHRIAAKEVLFALDQRQDRLEIELRELPELIQSSAYDLLRLTCNIEIERKKIAEKKLDAMTLISEIKDMGKPKYSNSDMREAAVKAMLKEDREYCDSVDILSVIEYSQRKQQIDLSFFENKFAACRSIAVMRGVKL